MTEQTKSEWNEVEGNLEDLGLENDSIPLPTMGVGEGTHRGHVTNMRFLYAEGQGRKLVITYRVNEEGNKFNGKTRDEWLSANDFDPVETKQWIKGRLKDLGVDPSEQKTLNIKSLIGTPIYFTVTSSVSKKNGKTYQNVTGVVLDTDGDFVTVTPDEKKDSKTVAASPRPKAVSAAELDY